MLFRSRDNDLYVFTHVEFKPIIEMRFANIMAAFDKSARSPALAKLPGREPSAMLSQLVKPAEG